MDEQSFESVYNLYSRLVFSVARRILHDNATAEEVAHEVFILVWRNAAVFDPARGSLVTWLLTLCRHKAIDRLRLKGERQRRVEDHAYDLPMFPVGCPFEFELDQERRGERIRGVLALLSVAQRTAIELAYFEELTHQEIAARLGAPLGTVKSWIRSGILRMRENLLNLPPAGATPLTTQQVSARALPFNLAPKPLPQPA